MPVSSMLSSYASFMASSHNIINGVLSADGVTASITTTATNALAPRSITYNSLYLRSTMTAIGHPNAISNVCVSAIYDTSYAVIRRTSPPAIHGGKGTTTSSSMDAYSLDVYCNGILVTAMDLPCPKIHGKVDEDVIFSGIAYDGRHGGRVVYVAETKVKEGDEEEDRFCPKPNYGEQLTSQMHPTLFMADLTSHTVTPLLQHPGDATLCAGDPSFTPDGNGVVFTGYRLASTDVHRLGLIYCYNRKSSIYHINVNECSDANASPATCLTPDDFASRSPHFKDNVLVYLATKYTVAHNTCSQLRRMDWESRVISTLVDVVYKLPTNDGFPGLYLHVLPQRPWLADGRLVLSTQWRSRILPVIIDCKTGAIERIPLNTGGEGGQLELASAKVLDVFDDAVLLAISDPFHCANAALWRQTDRALIGGITPSTEHTYEVRNIFREEWGSAAQGGVEAVVLRPPSSSTSRRLLISPHGGPHSAYSTFYLHWAAFFCLKLGYTVALVNYRGSVGFGLEHLESLLGWVGRHDVRETHAVAEDLRIDDINTVAVVGGSHGGFLSAHLIAQYPGYYNAAAMRNPVIDIAAMMLTTDIPDWCSATCGSDNADIQRKHSPIDHDLSLVTTPSLICIGSLDLRVPPAQGSYFHRLLSEYGVDTRLRIYPNDCHPISSPAGDTDMWVSTAEWLDEHLIENVHLDI